MSNNDAATAGVAGCPAASGLIRGVGVGAAADVPDGVPVADDGAGCGAGVGAGAGVGVAAGSGVISTGATGLGAGIGTAKLPPPLLLLPPPLLDGGAGGAGGAEPTMNDRVAGVGVATLPNPSVQLTDQLWLVEKPNAALAVVLNCTPLATERFALFAAPSMKSVQNTVALVPSDAPHENVGFVDAPVAPAAGARRESEGGVSIVNVIE